MEKNVIRLLVVSITITAFFSLGGAVSADEKLDAQLVAQGNTEFALSLGWPPFFDPAIKLGVGYP